MGLLMGLVALFFIIASLFPDLNLPNFKDLLRTENSKQIDSGIKNQPIEELKQSKQISLTALENDTSAWDLLVANHEVLYQEYDFGVFVEAIDDLKGNQDNFWAIYVNGESALEGVQDIVLNEGDIIEFKYEAIKK
jgi:hypothetical protein